MAIMGNFLGIRLPNASSVVPMLSGVAPFIPGVGAGVKAGLIGLNGLLQGSDAARKSRNLQTQQQNVYNGMIQQGQSQASDAQTRLRTMLDEYDKIIQGGGIPGFDSRYRQMVESAAPSYDSAVSQTMMDFGGRGIGGSALGAAVGGLRQNQARTANDAARSVFQTGVQNRTNMIQQGIPMLNGMMQQGNQLQFQGTQGLGGIGAMYASKEQGFGDSLGKLAELAIPALTGSGNPDAGNNSLGTNQRGIPGVGQEYVEPDGNSYSMNPATSEQAITPMGIPVPKRRNTTLGMRLPNIRVGG